MKIKPEKIGIYEAKAKLSELLERVGNGETIVIAKHGHPVARLISCANDALQKRKSATATLRQLRKKYELNGLSVRKLREKGRK